MSGNRSKKHRFPKSLKRKVLRLQGNLCFYCGSELNMTSADPHHKIPVSLGGLTVQENLVMVCRDCHNKIHGEEPPLILEQKKWGIFC